MHTNKVFVDCIVNIGGDLPESKLDSFINQIVNLYLSNPNEYPYKNSYKENKKSQIKGAIIQTVNKPLTLNLPLENGELDKNLIAFCSLYNLQLTVENFPFIDNNGILRNNSLYVHTNKNPGLQCIPLDGEGNPTTIVEDVFEVIKEIFDEIEKPLIETPKYINEHGISGDVAKRKLKNEPLRKILTEILRSRIAYPDSSLPPFNVIKGV